MNLIMENSPFDTNNPYKKTPKTHPTLPLEPRVSREEQEAMEKYMPRPPRPDDADAPQADGATPATPTQGVRRTAPRSTINFPAQPGPRVYETPSAYAEPSPTPSLRPRPTVTYQPGQMPQTLAEPIPSEPAPGQPIQNPAEPVPSPAQPIPAPAKRPYLSPDVTDSATDGRSQAHRNVRKATVRTDQSHRPTVRDDISDHSSLRPPYDRSKDYPYDTPDTPRKKNIGMLAGIVAAALIVIGAGCWWYFGHNDTKANADDETAQDVAYNDYISTDSPADATGNNTEASTSSTSSGESSSSGVSAGTETTSLFNRPLTYTGTVTPGGVATLNIILFQNGRLEGTIDYSGGKSMPLFGSYTWTDNGHMMNVNFTVSSKSDKAYSESWMGHSSYIKDDLAHTLTFKRINTSSGQSMTASFALRQ